MLCNIHALRGHVNQSLSDVYTMRKHATMDNLLELLRYDILLRWSSSGTAVHLIHKELHTGSANWKCKKLPLKTVRD